MYLTSLKEEEIRKSQYELLQKMNVRQNKKDIINLYNLKLNSINDTKPLLKEQLINSLKEFIDISKNTDENYMYDNITKYYKMYKDIVLINV